VRSGLFLHLMVGSCLRILHRGAPLLCYGSGILGRKRQGDFDTSFGLCFSFCYILGFSYLL
jgi:hypothetical protein